PLRPGTYFIGLAVLSSSSGPGTIVANISTGAPAIGVASSLDFGSVVVGQNRELSLSVRNTGTDVLTVQSLSSSSAQVRLVSPSTPFNVAAAAEQAVVMRFQPTAPGSQTSTLTIASSDPARPSLTVALSGQGVAGSGIAISATSLTFNAQTGTNPPPQTFTVRNSGGGTLNYQVSSNQPWLSVSPVAGSSTGAANTITASVITAGLGGGTYNAELRVSQTSVSGLSADGMEQAAPVVIAVRLTLTDVASVSAATFSRGTPLAPE